MKNMIAAILVEPNKMEIKEIPIPKPQNDWVRIKNKASGICGSDIHIYTGNHPWLKPGNPMAKYVLGNIYGHEIAGIVDEIGENVDNFKVGDRVGVIAIIPCQKCEYCKVGLYQICKDLKHYGFHYPGGFAEYTLVPADYLFKIPEKLSFEEAALVDVLVVGLHAVNIAQVSLADRVTILGSGPIGLAVASSVKRAGARDIFVTADFDLQVEVLKKLGIKVENILKLSDKDIIDKIMRKSDGRGVDCVIESIGYKAKTIQLGIEIIRKGGRIIFIGVFEEPVCLNFGDILAKEATIRASHAFGMWGIVPEVEIALEMLTNGEFPAKETITHKYPLEKINEAFMQKINDSANTLKVQIIF